MVTIVHAVSRYVRMTKRMGFRMPMMRASLPLLAFCAVLGSALTCRAEVGTTSDFFADGSGVAAAPAEGTAFSNALPSEQGTTDKNPPIGLESDLEPGTESDEQQPTEPQLDVFEDSTEGVIYLNGGPPPAYSFGYNRMRGALTWIPGQDDRFGWLSYETLGSASIDSGPSLITDFGIHLLDGPVQTDMPPRLFDFSIGVADRRLIQPNFGYDVVFRVGAFSDFEGSAGDGVRYPSHAVTFLRMTPTSEFVLGIDYLDRDDIRLLPVIGTIWSPVDWLNVEAVFPRPRIAARIHATPTWVYLGGELGGGTWAIERVNLVDDNATYRDLRLVLGCETLHPNLPSSSIEIGYVFDRKLSYSSNIGDYEPANAVMLRMSARY
jgi:hypothetical protein